MKSSPRSATNLVADIYGLLDGKAKISPERIKVLADRLAQTIGDNLNDGNKQHYLRISNFGTECERKLWYYINTPEDAEPLEPHARFKFLIGHILEDLGLFLTEETGRKVTKRQHEVELHGVKGHIDALVDGVLFDVKSTSVRQFDKFKLHQLEKDDPFAYKAQLNMYMEALKEDPDLSVKGEYAFLAINKELGHMVVDRYRTQKDKDWEQEVSDKRAVLARASPPGRAYTDVPDGASGNRQLPVACRYCPYKQTCWPGLRTFVYSNGPRYLTTVAREPNVYEVK